VRYTHYRTLVTLLAKLGGGGNPRCKVIGGQGSAEAKYPDSAPDGKRQSWDSTAVCVSGSVRYRAICRPKHLDLGTYPSVTGGFSWGLRSVATRETGRSMPHTHQMVLPALSDHPEAFTSVIVLLGWSLQAVIGCLKGGLPRGTHKGVGCSPCTMPFCG
jgi:hypothetical protein